MPRLILLALLAASRLESHAAPAPLTWEELRGLARERSPVLSGAGKTWRASRSAVQEAQGGYLPRITLNADRTRSKSELASAESRKTELRYGATASLNLFQGFATAASVAKAKAAEGVAESDLKLAGANLRHDLRLAFFEAYVWQERLRLYEKDLQRVRQNLRLVELKYKSGTEARWNLKESFADLERAQYNAANSRAQLAIARESLASLVYLDSLPEERAVAAPDPRILQDPAPPRAEGASRHPELLRSRFARDQAAQDVRLARSGFFPSLDLSFTRSRLDSRPDGQPFARTDSSSLALTAEWNIFNGTIDHFKAQQAGLSLEAAELSDAGLERRLLATLRSKRASFRALLLQLPVSRAEREAAEERERTVSEQYRSGLKSYLDWEQAETRLLSAEQGEIKALSDALAAFAGLELAEGLDLEQP